MLEFLPNGDVHAVLLVPVCAGDGLVEFLLGLPERLGPGRASVDVSRLFIVSYLCTEIYRFPLTPTVAFTFRRMQPPASLRSEL